MGIGSGPDGSSFDDYLDEVARAPALSLDEEAELARAAVSGDDAAGARLVRSSLRIVVALARRYAATGVPLADLVHEGNAALVRAVHSYDPARGFAFRSYATWIVRRALATLVSGTIEDERLAELQDAWDAFVAAAGRQPSLEELARESGLSPADVLDLLGRPPGG